MLMYSPLCIPFSAREIAEGTSPQNPIAWTKEELGHDATWQCRHWPKALQVSELNFKLLVILACFAVKVFHGEEQAHACLCRIILLSLK